MKWNMGIRSHSLTAVLFFIISFVLLENARATPDCVKFGKPSYTADRVVQLGSEKISSKVFVMGDSEREEVFRGNTKIEVIITTPTETMRFSPDQKTGLRIPAPPIPKQTTDHIRVREQDVGGNKHLFLEFSDKSGKWQLISEATCRPDGVLLAKKTRVPINGKLVEANMSQTILSVGKVDEALFTPPSDIRFQQAPKGVR